MSRKAVLHLICLVSSLGAGAPGASAAPEIPWSADRPLTWDDFQGPVAKRSAPIDVAATAASLSWTYEYDFEWSKEACTYRITDIRASAVFHPRESWVKPGHRTAAVLEHEQGHFDITQIHKLMFEALSRGLVGEGGTCKGRNARRISDFIEKEIARRAGSLYERVWLNHMRVQEAYDLETAHGMEAAAQRSWLERIAAGLRGERWAGLRLHRPAR